MVARQGPLVLLGAHINIYLYLFSGLLMIMLLGHFAISTLNYKKKKLTMGPQNIPEMAVAILC